MIGNLDIVARNSEKPMPRVRSQSPRRPRAVAGKPIARPPPSRHLSESQSIGREHIHSLELQPHRTFLKRWRARERFEHVADREGGPAQIIVAAQHTIGH
jgi:hypothetical protein